jgi:thymidine phosphorylase
VIPQEIIRIKRDGGTLSHDQIKAFIGGLTDGRVGDGQVAAFAMAVFLKGMDRHERIALTLAMRDSGRVLDWAKEGLNPALVVDKHSTGGVGDKVSLMLAPMVAACGGYVPMISGRGLGHTGGTLDKFDSIPGYTTAPDEALFTRVVREVGCAVIGQTSDLAPADRRLYAIRDVTATVESLPLITASILSKKLAAGLGALVMDVKFGTGAFMNAYADAHALAESICDVANGAGVPTVALLTDMNEVLGDSVGNALEMKEAVGFLTGARREPRLLEVTLALCAQMLVLSGLASSDEAARAMLMAVLDNGKAAEVFSRMVATLGGPAGFVDAPERCLEAAPLVAEVKAEHSGVLQPYNAREAGLALIDLGGGRIDPAQRIDHAVGMDRFVRPGTPMNKGDVLCRIHARDEASLARAKARLSALFILSEAPVVSGPMIRDRVS